MTDQTKRFVLWISSALCGVGAIGLVSATVTSPLPAPPPTASLVTSTSIRPKPNQVVASFIGEDEFRYVWGKRLRQPLVEPIKKKVERVVPVETPDPPAPAFRIDAVLLGTLVDHDREFARAWIEYKGKKHVVRAGDAVTGHPANPTVTAIEDRRLVLAVGSQRHSLELPRSKFASAAESVSITGEVPRE